MDGRILDLAAPRVPAEEPTLCYFAQVRNVLSACNPEVPTEDLLVRLLVGSGHPPGRGLRAGLGGA